MKEPFFKYCLLLLLLFFASGSPFLADAFSNEPCTLLREESKMDLSPCLEYLPEGQKRLSIEEVAGIGKGFQRAESTNHGFVDSAYWLRLTINNPDGTELSRLIEIRFPFLDKVELYAPDRDGSFRVQRNGRALPFSRRLVKDRNIVFPVTLLPGTHRYYLRIETESAMFFPLLLWQEQHFWQEEKRAHFALGIYYGIMAAMALYNLFLFVSLKDRAYLYYVLYIVSFALYQMTANGLAYEYLWPDAIWWNRHSTIFFAGLSTIFASLFSRGFLNTKEVASLLDKALLGICLASVLLILSSLFLGYGTMVKATLALASVFVGLMLLSGLLSLAKGQRSARFYLLAWGFLLTGIAILILRNIGLLPPNFFVLYAIQIGSILDVLLLSFALADRINELRSSKEAALRQAIRERQKSQEQRETMIRELHDGIGAIATNISVLAQKARLLNPSKEVDGDLALISDLAHRGRAEIQHFMECLDQGEIGLKDLAAELRHGGNRLMGANGIGFALKVVDEACNEIKFSPFERLHIEKIYQEALTNVIKHAGASNVWVELSTDDENFIMTIKDDGQAMAGAHSSHPAGAPSGRGLKNMEKRAKELKGAIEIRVEDGVELRVLIPIFRARNRDQKRGDTDAFAHS